MLAEPHVLSPGPSTSDCKNHLLQRQVEGVCPFSQQISSEKSFVFFCRHFVSKELSDSKRKPAKRHLSEAPTPGLFPQLDPRHRWAGFPFAVAPRAAHMGAVYVGAAGRSRRGAGRSVRGARGIYQRDSEPSVLICLRKCALRGRR